jgi:hypothetical protein
MAITTEQMHAVFASIDSSLKRLVEIAERRVVSREPKVDLDGTHGDPVVKFKPPRDWAGDSMNGRHFSECPAAYLDLLADRFDFFNTKPDVAADKKQYNTLDAARARGWAARIRSGYTPPVAETGAMVGEDEISFD